MPRPVIGHRAIAISAMLAIVAAALAAPPGGKSRGPRKPPASRAADPLEAERALYAELPEVTLDGLPLDEFVEWLARQTKVVVTAHWGRLEKEGITRETEIRLRMKNVRIADLLRTVLDQLGEGKAPLGFRAEENIITISTRAELDRLLVIETYDVQDLLVEIPDFEALHPTGGSGVARLGAGQSSGPARSRAADPAQKLIDIITTCVYPSTWKVNGGSGTIQHFQGRFVIRNTPEVHRALHGTLRARGDSRRR